MSSKPRVRHGFYAFCLFSAVLLMCHKTVDAEVTNPTCEAPLRGGAHYLVDSEQAPRALSFFNEQLVDLFEHSQLFELSHFLYYGPEHQLIENRYFDTPDFDLLNQGVELAVHTRLDLSKYVEGRRFVILRRADPTNGKPALSQFLTREYSRKVTSLDKHSLIGMIKRSERNRLLNQLNDAGLSEITALQDVITTLDDNLSMVIRGPLSAYAAVTLVQSRVSVNGLSKNTFTTRVERFGNTEPKLNTDEERQLEKLLTTVNCALSNILAGQQPSQWIGYRYYSTVAESVFPHYQFFRKHPSLFRLGQAALIAFFGFLVLFLILKGRCRKITSLTKRTVFSSKEQRNV